VQTMTGDFVQFGPKGEQTGGKFFIERPGKIRFNYEKPSPIRVVADGKSVVINNKKLDTWDIYSLSKTPLKLLLSENIDLSDGKVKNVKEEDDLTTIVLGDKSIFGDSKISMMFDPKSSDLRQWTITDAKGLDTTVMIFNVKQGEKIDPAVFKIDYLRVTEANQRKK
jgi:outer membrane lipoprotein-sorting protein